MPTAALQSCYTRARAHTHPHIYTHIHIGTYGTARHYILGLAYRREWVIKSNISDKGHGSRHGSRDSTPKSAIFIVRKGRTTGPQATCEQTKKARIRRVGLYACDRRPNFSMGFLSDVVSL